MTELANWIAALQAQGHVLSEIRVASPWADYLVAEGVMPAGDISPPEPGEECRAVALTAAGERFNAILCG